MDIKELRKKTNLTQTQFGELFGIPMRTIQNWEYGRYKAPDYVVNMIEEILYSRGILREEDDIVKTFNGIFKNISYVCSIQDNGVHVYCDIDDKDKDINMGKDLCIPKNHKYINDFAELYIDLAIDESNFDKEFEKYEKLHS